MIPERARWEQWVNRLTYPREMDDYVQLFFPSYSTHRHLAKIERSDIAGDGVASLVVRARRLPDAMYPGDSLLLGMEIDGRKYKRLFRIAKFGPGKNRIELSGRLDSTHTDGGKAIGETALGDIVELLEVGSAPTGIDDDMFLDDTVEPRIKLSITGASIVGNTRASLLEQLEGAGYSPVYGCRMGACHTCTCTKLSGIVKDMTTGQHSSSDREVIKICISTALTHVVLEL